ncbi:MAG: TolC family protein, partial [Candidatus Omnitrophica bacterium]|nr:TolC family protein [Candidatus Omnitrophota bacterium]
FDQFYSQVLSHYPKLKSAGTDVELGWARKMQASAGFWPSLSLSAGYTESDDPVNVFGMKLRQEQFAQSDFEINRLNSPRHQRDLQGGVHVRWPLVDAMQTVHRVRAAREEIKAAQDDEAFTKMEVFVLAHDAYTGALALNGMLAAAEEADRTAQEDLKKADDLKKRGVVLGADFYAARVRAGRFVQARNNLVRQVKAMQMLMNIMRGQSLGSEIVLPLTMPATAVDDLSADVLVGSALQARPDFLAITARINAGQEELKRARDSALPTVLLTADGTNNRHDLNDRGGNNVTVGVLAELPLFDPAREGRLKEAAALLTRARLEEDSLKDAAARDIARESARFDALRDNNPVVKAMADDAAQAVEMLLPLYNEGRKSIIDLEEAREARFNALSAYEEMKASLASSEARLYFLGGKLDEPGMRLLAQKLMGKN